MPVKPQTEGAPAPAAENLRGALQVLSAQSADIDTWPVIYHLDITGRCNLSCLYCQRDFFLSTRHPFLKGDMPEEVFEAVRPYFRHAKLVALLSMLGEPLVVRALPRWWTAVIEAGAKPQTTTNGTFLTPELADLFTGTGGRLKISIDTFDQAALDVLRPSMKADLLRDRLDLIARCRRRHGSSPFELGVNVCVTARNADSVLATLEECMRRVRVDVFTFSQFRLPRDEQGRYHENARSLTLPQDASLGPRWQAIYDWCRARQQQDGVRFILPFSRTEWIRLQGAAGGVAPAELEEPGGALADTSDYYCCVPWLKVHVLLDGSVIPCHLLQWTAPELVFGNVRERSFEEIWRGREFSEFRRGMAAGDRYPFCGQCTSWWRFYTAERVD